MFFGKLLGMTGSNSKIVKVQLGEGLECFIFGQMRVWTLFNFVRRGLGLMLILLDVGPDSN